MDLFIHKFAHGFVYGKFLSVLLQRLHFCRTRGELRFRKFQVILQEGKEVAAACLETEVLKETCVSRVTFGP